MTVELTAQVSVPDLPGRHRIAILKPLQLLRYAAAGLVLAVLLLLFSLNPVFAQQPEVAALGAKLGNALSNAGVKKVAIFDFTGPGKGTTQIGATLTEQLFESLAADGKSYKMISRSELAAAFQRENMDPRNPWDEPSLGVARWIARRVGASALVIGALAEDPDGVRLAVDSYQVRGNGRIDGFGVTIPKTSDLGKLIGTSASNSSKAALVPSAKGYGIPACRSCPAPAVPAETIRAKGIGTVVLGVVVNAAGRVIDIRVVKDPGDDMAQRAIETVFKWQMTPANGPDGKPADVRTLVELTFRLLGEPQ